MDESGPSTAAARSASSTLLDHYRRMLTIRRFEERCLELGGETVAGSIHLCAGQEAIPVGTRVALRNDDKVVATYRGHGWAIEWGVPLSELLAEICHREAGVNGGRAGSAYLIAPGYSFLGENSIVGAGVPIAAGVALAAKRRASGTICVVSIGDGAMNQGATHEGLNFAAVRALPLIVIVENNEWSEMTPIARTAKVSNLSERAAGYGMPGITVDGNDPEAVRAAVTQAAGRARAGQGPTLIEAKTVRLMAHYNRDIEHYRSSAEKAEARLRDPLPRLHALLREHGISAERLETIESELIEELDAVTRRVLSLPGPEPSSARRHVVACPAAAPGSPVAAEPEEMLYWQAVNTALQQELASRSETLLYGEDVGAAGGIFGCTRGLQREFSDERVFDTPISESAILGSAVGAALEGLRPIVEIMWADFMLVALDQLVNQAANLRYLTRGKYSLPLVVRTQQGSTPGSCAQHSQSLEALLCHIPGLRVGIPSHPDDAYSMLRAAISDSDPTVVIEARSLYQTKGEVCLLAEAPPVGGATFRRRGSDLAIISWGAMSLEAEQAADRLAQQGVEATVLDLRWLSPLDEEALALAVETGGRRALVVHEANLTGGFGAEVAARIGENISLGPRASVRRLATPDVRIPAAPSLRAALIPDTEAIVAASLALLSR